MHRINKAIDKAKKNRKGYTLIEVLVVVFIILALTTVSLASFSAYYRARSSKVSKTIDTLIAQSKIDSLSGRENFMVIRHKTDYDSNEHGIAQDSEYYAELYKVDGDKAIRYKKEGVGNSWVTLSFNNATEVSENSLIVLKFNMKTGAVDHISASEVGELFSPPASEDEVRDGVGYDASKFTSIDDAKSEIYIISGQTHVIELYTASGEHQIV